MENLLRPKQTAADRYIHIHERKTALSKKAASLRKHEFDSEAILRALRLMNNDRCKPPMDDQELVAIDTNSQNHKPENARFARGGIAEDVSISTAERPLFKSWGEIRATDYPKVEWLVRGLVRGTVGFVNALTNLGKSSLLRNLLISLATGRAFLNLTSGGVPLRVMLLDYETPPGMYKDDIETMTAIFTDEEKELLIANCFTYLAGDSSSDGLNLSSPLDYQRLADAIANLKSDVIVIDTMSMAFAMKSENDNSEAANQMKQLQKLARVENAVILLTHHIGKASLDEGGAKNSPYVGRGASAFGASATANFQLDRRKSGENILRFTKIKGVTPDDIVLKLNPETRWFEIVDGAKAYRAADESRRKLIGLIDRAMDRSEIDLLAMTQLKFSKSSVTRLLSEAISKEEIQKVRHGVYAPGEIPFKPTMLENLN